jgi:hypothetical protein
LVVQRGRRRARRLLPRLRRPQPVGSPPSDALWQAAQQLAAAARRLAAATQALAAATQQLTAAEPARAAYARPAHRELRGVRGVIMFGPAHYTSRRSSYPARRQSRSDSEPN